MNCPNCGNTVQDQAAFCDQCGTRLETATQAAEPTQAAPVAQAPQPLPSPASEQPVSDVILCSACGAENTPGEMFCVDCGTPLQAPVPDANAELPAPQVEPLPEPEPAETVAAPAPVAEAPEAQRPDRSAATRECPSCGTVVAQDDAFCYACGTRLPQQPSPAGREEEEPAAESAPAEEAAPAATAFAPTAASESVSQPAAEPQPTPQAAPDECPSCGAKIKPGDVFCDFCGAALVNLQAGAPAPTTAAQATPLGTGAAGEEMPYLVIAESNMEIELPQGTEVLVGREDPYGNAYPDVDLTPHGAEEKGVSRRHFKITLADGRYAIQDLGSTNYTWVNQQRLEPNVPTRLTDGDEIRAGRLKLIFRTRS